MSSTPKPRSRNGRTAPARGAVAVMLRSMQVGQLVIAAVLVVIGAVHISQALCPMARIAGFDVVVIDPPAFIRRRKDHPKGLAAYRKLNQLAMQLVDRDGFLVSCSCSHHLGLDDLMVTIQQAARHVDRFAQVVEVGGHAPDHPLHPAIAETRYLKSLFCRVVQD